MDIGYILRWILFLDIVALTVINFRIDRDAYFTAILDMLFGKTFIGFILGLTVVYLILPITLVINIFKLFK